MSRSPIILLTSFFAEVKGRRVARQGPTRSVAGVGMTGEDAAELPQSRRPDGSLRPAVRVRKGYVPPEEQQTYDRFKDTTPAGTVFGAETVDPGAAKGKSRSRGKKKKPEGGDANAEAGAKEDEVAPVVVEAAPVSEAAAQGASDVEKKIKALRKRLRGIEELEARAKEEGVELNADQLSKIAAKPEVEAEILKWETLGDVDVGKKIKNLKKKLKQIDELEQKLGSGLSLNEDQQGKVQAKEEVMQELKTLEALA